MIEHRNFWEKGLKCPQRFINRSDVRVDVGLNKHIWSMGVRNVAKRVRVRLSRRRNEDEEAKEKVEIVLIE